MIIRNTQLASLAAFAEGRFSVEALEHLRQFAPELHRLRGDAAFLKVIQEGLARAANYGFTLRGPLRTFLELMVSYGYGFDTDPMLSWLREAEDPLDPATGDEMVRARQLWVRSVNYSDGVEGPGGVHALAALRRLAALPLSVSFASGQDLQLGLSRIYPERFGSVELENLRAIVSKAIAVANSHELPPEGTITLIIAMLGFGHEVMTDPLYPWVASTIADRRVERRRASERLREKMKTYAEAVAANVG